jgi:hypothetical protein
MLGNVEVDICFKMGKESVFAGVREAGTACFVCCFGIMSSWWGKDGRRCRDPL